jgi:transcriptional regulator of acetoin/glycerol metabolism
VTVRLPALRERRDDVALIAKKLSKVRLTPRALRKLAAHSWPGNVRELANELRRLEALGLTDADADDLLPAAESASATPAPLGTLRELERAALIGALRAALGNKARAAEILGIPRGSLWHRVRHHKIRESEWRSGPLTDGASDRPPS